LRTTRVSLTYRAVIKDGVAQYINDYIRTGDKDKEKDKENNLKSSERVVEAT